MKFGVVLTGTDQDVLELGREAEAAGWDGVFLPDDWGAALIRLTAIAMRTQRVRLGTMLTPLPQHLPWIVAAQSATLDQLCGGRMILGLGLGVNELDKIGLEENRVRAQMLDEGLAIVARG